MPQGEPSSADVAPDAGEISGVHDVSGTSASYTNCRFGSAAIKNSIAIYDTARLNLGWYSDWRTALTPVRPHGMEYAQTIRVNEANGVLSYSPSGATLNALVLANPGAMWLIGNEPDCIYQDNVLPESYAVIYHNAYTFIKLRDPSARVYAGGIVQPTPLRLEYLDRVYAAYVSTYGDLLPADGWHIHSYILREADCDVYWQNCWGSEIPPGIDASHGELYEIEDGLRQDIFQQRLVSFRRWMLDHGYRDVPLVITEFGTLFPHDYAGYDLDSSRAYMTGVFDYLLSASDANLGYPLDENRLVQQWLWWSLDDDPDATGGGLVSPTTPYALTPMGSHFAAYTSAVSPHVDLLVGGVRTLTHLRWEGQPLTATVRARIANSGNISVTQPFAVRFTDGLGMTVATAQITRTLPGCAAYVEVELTWSGLTPGVHQLRVFADSGSVIPEADESNNQAIITVLVTDRVVLLPSVMRVGQSMP